LPFSCDIILVRIILADNEKKLARSFNAAPVKVFMCLEVYSNFEMFV